ncbi:DNA replication ATP-dependent helicase/nuclease JHS1-like [Spinacia oleracea]|uniref:DNA replication ATP-dependent helicase/nuclease JHS1-like n=1 Tax=Spinacia oleracea TaxID=3562 RepID=A0ABM3RMW6_SPIOL|nr:DNA replication ATP-dependent helicase/nuclease JHS1-like [Spinacia oleracea]XP_056696950.1 DNA replication ATP-dependent helicase/nuclease JHS1-like [Spinacia oleracea]
MTIIFLLYTQTYYFPGLGFNCPRRAVLDERLRGGETSTAALTGTLLHQIFQAGLLRENPTIEPLQEFAKSVIQKNIQGMYACEVQEKDMCETLNNTIPMICNWIKYFRDSQISNAPTVDKLNELKSFKEVFLQRFSRDGISRGNISTS